jgi:hypothetical protein
LFNFCWMVAKGKSDDFGFADQNQPATVHLDS